MEQTMLMDAEVSLSLPNQELDCKMQVWYISTSNYGILQPALPTWVIVNPPVCWYMRGEKFPASYPNKLQKWTSSVTVLFVLQLEVNDMQKWIIRDAWNATRHQSLHTNQWLVGRNIANLRLWFSFREYGSIDWQCAISTAMSSQRQHVCAVCLNSTTMMCNIVPHRLMWERQLHGITQESEVDILQQRIQVNKLLFPQRTCLGSRSEPLPAQRKQHHAIRYLTHDKASLVSGRNSSVAVVSFFPQPISPSLRSSCRQKISTLLVQQVTYII